MKFEMKCALLYVLTTTLLIACKGKSTDRKLGFSERVRLYIDGSESLLPIPTNTFEEKYLQIVLDDHASKMRVANDKEIANLRLKLDKDISIVNLYAQVALVIFSVIFAVVGLVFGIINVGAGTLYPTPQALMTTNSNNVLPNKDNHLP